MGYVAAFSVGVVVGVVAVFLMSCGKRADVAVEAAREAKRKGTHTKYEHSLN